MSKYTTEVRFICENYSGLKASVGQASVNETIANSRSKVFDFPYPIFDEEYRGVLETKILKHYYTREICAETVGLWKLWLDTKMNEIMPYYNELYKSTLYEFDPYNDVDITTTRTDKNFGVANGKEDTDRTNKGKTTNNSSTNDNGTNWQYYSDTPQGSVGNLDSLSYLTNATKNTNNGTTSTETTANYEDNGKDKKEHSNEFSNTEEYIEHIIGKRGSTSYSVELKQFRETILNIDMMIIDELGDLFMNLW